jgi:hypothetical protein
VYFLYTTSEWLVVDHLEFAVGNRDASLLIDDHDNGAGVWHGAGGQADLTDSVCQLLAGIVFAPVLRNHRHSSAVHGRSDCRSIQLCNSGRIGSVVLVVPSAIKSRRRLDRIRQIVKYFDCNVTRSGERGATSGRTGWLAPVSCLHHAEGRHLFTTSTSSVPVHYSATRSAAPTQSIKTTPPKTSDQN